MWILFVLLAAFFAGITTIFSKIGVSDVDSSLATFLRTIVIMIFTIIVVFIVGSFTEIYNLNFKTILFLILSGIITALLWLTYFKALTLAPVNKVSPVDKLSIVLTLIFSSIFLNEKITLVKIISMILIIVGSYLMTTKDDNAKVGNKNWIIYALLTALFTSLATIFGKIGLSNVEANFGVMVKTIIVFIILLIIVLAKKKLKNIKTINKKSWIFILLSGFTTGLSWLCYFIALKQGEASIIFPIEKLSIVVAGMGSVIFLKEKFSKKSIVGLISILCAVLLLMI